MKLLIFGSTGPTGRQLVEQALAGGHAVTAFARNPTLGCPNANLRVVQGDVMNADVVERAMRGQDAVLVALGARALWKNTVRSEGTRRVIGVMEKLGVRRLVCLSTMGIGDSRELLPFHMRYIVVPLLLRQVFAEHARQEEFVRQSKTEWTIVRPGGLTNGSRTGRYRHGILLPEGRIKARISRADIAEFMLQQSSDPTYLYKAPWISY